MSTLLLGLIFIAGGIFLFKRYRRTAAKIADVEERIEDAEVTLHVIDKEFELKQLNKDIIKKANKL